MKLVAILLFLALSLIGANSQGMGDLKPPPEMAKMGTMMAGEWTATLKMSMGASTTDSAATMKVSKILGGRFIEAFNSYAMGPGMNMEGVQLLTYDVKAKKFRAWWFDQSESQALELEGPLEGGKLTLTSKPTSLDNVHGVTVIRTTYAYQSETKIGFLLEMKSEDKWVKMAEGTYSKKP